MSMPPPANPPPAWYPDPTNKDHWRYWHGTAWSRHTAPRSLPSPPSPSRVPTHPPTQAPEDHHPAAESTLPGWAYFVAAVIVLATLLLLSHYAWEFAADMATGDM